MRDLQMLPIGSINEEEALKVLEMIKLKKEILNVHNKPITQKIRPYGVIWFTKVGNGKNAKNVEAKTEEGLYKKLQDFYGINTFTLTTLFNKYQEYRRTISSVTQKTTEEDANIFNRFIKKKRISNVPLTKIELKDYDTLFHSLSRDGITKKNQNAVKSLINRMYKYGNIYHNLNIASPLDKIDFNMYSCQVVDNRENTYTEEDIQTISDYMDSLENKDDYDYAICLLCEMIARIGEVKALKWDNIKEDYIWIAKTVDSDGNCLDRTKNKRVCGNRENPLTERAKRILSEIPKTDSPYIFSNSIGGFLDTNTFNSRLQSICKKAGVEYHSSHKIRFANITRMANAGIPLTHIQYWAGHSTLRQTEDYVRSTQKPSRDIYNSTLLN